MISLNEVRHLLKDSNPQTLEQLAQKAHALTRQYFGRTISLYTPLYLSNYCSSYCTYCNFNSHNRIKRAKLTDEQIKQEMKYISSKGIQNILLLTGESRDITPLSYLKNAVEIAKDFFPSISLEVFPMDTHEYKELFLSGVDGITLYQETYDKKIYRQVHLAGEKKNYDYRVDAPRRIAASGIRNISMGILLGLSEPTEDICMLFEHLRLMEKNFPGIEYSLSFPRLRPIKEMNFTPYIVDDKLFIKTVCLARILFPRVGINLSTRESSELRNHALELGITKISAESKTSVGGYSIPSNETSAPQFDIQDDRSVESIAQMLKERNFDPVFTDWRRIPNESL